jgi:hypothetical protein
MKISCIVASVIALQLGGTAQAGLVGYWAGDGNADDGVLANHGTLTLGAGFGPGRFGQAFAFNGGSGRVEIPSISAYAFGTGDFSVSFWVSFDVLSNAAVGMVSKDSFGSGGGFNGWLFNQDDGAGGLGILTRDSSVTATTARASSGTFSLGEWYHFAGVRNANTVSFYVNGILRASATESVPTNVTNVEPLRIGSLSPGSLQTMDGMVDEVRLYSHALSAAEVQSLAVPEPAAATLLAVSAGAICLRRRRSI